MADTESAITVLHGISPRLRVRAAQLYEIAFGEKLAVAIPATSDRIHLLSKTMQLEFAIGAYNGDRLIGIAVFSTTAGSLTDGIDYHEVISELGWIRGNCAAIVLALYERKAKDGDLLMDGIVVDPDYRSKGVGTRLFASLIDYAKSQGYSTIRLDVIDTHPGARRLYERLGFFEEKTEKFEFLRSMLGFGASTTMNYSL